jgi:hypothetical protein
LETRSKENNEELAVEAANCDYGAARDADAGDEDDEEYGDGSDGGAGQEIEEDVIKVHEDEYAARKGFGPVTTRLGLKF